MQRPGSAHWFSLGQHNNNKLFDQKISIVYWQEEKLKNLFPYFHCEYPYSGNKLLPLGEADNGVFCGMSDTMATCRADMIRRCSSIKDLGFYYAASNINAFSHFQYFWLSYWPNIPNPNYMYWPACWKIQMAWGILFYLWEFNKFKVAAN